MRQRPTSLLDQLYAHSTEAGWPAGSLDIFRMEAGEGEGGTGEGGEGGEGGQGGSGEGAGGTGAGESGSGAGGGQGGSAPAKPAAKPPWGTDTEFNPEAAWKLIQGLRSDKEKAAAKVAELEPFAVKARELEDAQKTELQRANERAEKAEKELPGHQAKAMRLEVAMEKGLTLSQAKRLVGTTREELEADADDLLADLGAAAKAPGAKEVIPGKPNDGLGTGGEGAPDPKKIAQEALARGRR